MAHDPALDIACLFDVDTDVGVEDCWRSLCPEQGSSRLVYLSMGGALLSQQDHVARAHCSTILNRIYGVHFNE